MAQYIPGSSVTLAASLNALRNHHAVDDTNIQTRLPSICVDYLNHQWDEEDVWLSWRSMTRYKDEIANGVRLENASWRTWWQQRNHLKTVKPESLDWSKDSDITWLYGPLHTTHAVPPLKVSTTEERYNLEPHRQKPAKPRPKPAKSILKRRTISELLKEPSLTTAAIHPQDNIGAAGGAEGKYFKVEASPLRRSTSQKRLSMSEGEEFLSSSQRSTVSTISSVFSDTPPSSSDSGKRHISFNTSVEQCVPYQAVAPPPRRAATPKGRFDLPTGEMDPIEEDEYDYARAAFATSERGADGYGHAGRAHRQEKAYGGGSAYGMEDDDDDDEWDGDDPLAIKARRRANIAAAAGSGSGSGSKAPPHAPRAAPSRDSSHALPTRSNPFSTPAAPVTIRKIAPTVLTLGG